MASRTLRRIEVALPPFRGTTRRILLAALGTYFGLVLLRVASAELEGLVAGLLSLEPQQGLHRLLWQFATYPFVPTGIGNLLSLLFSLLSFWFFGAMLEAERGSKWLRTYFFLSVVGGGLLASVLALLIAGHIPGIDGTQRSTSLWGPVLALLLAYASFHPDQELSFNFLFRIRAKYLAAIYLLLYLAGALVGGERFDALVVLCNALCGLAYARFMPRYGWAGTIEERWFGLRNSFYRSKRRRAARKFAAYMRKEGSEVSYDRSGRYVDPDGKPREPRDSRDSPDSKWMN